MRTQYNIPDSQFKIMDLQDIPPNNIKRFMVLCSVMMYEKGKGKRTRFYLGQTREVSNYTKEAEIKNAKRYLRIKLQEALEAGEMEIGAAKKKKFIDAKKTSDIGIEFVTHSKLSSRKFSTIPMVVAES